MSFSISRAGRIISATLVSLTAIAGVVFAQQQQRQPATDQIEVIRISTELVQTGVVVLDKQGKFVEGLKPEQFLLKVDGKPVTPIFFEHVVAGTDREEKLEAAAARGTTAQALVGLPSSASYRGRTIVFFIDDLHLSKASMERTRAAMLEFIDKQMALDDYVAIASPSGQIGFLQRFTDLKPVARAAVGRLNYRPYTVRDHEHIPMSEYQALRIEQGDADATDYFVTELQKAHNFKIPAGGALGPPSGGPMLNPRSQGSGTQPGLTREVAVRLVKERAGFMMRQSESVTGATLATLESLMRTSTQLPGRKLVFFVSDGFFLNDRNTAFGDKLKQITDAAVRAGVVVYSVDARGMVSGVDAASNRADPTGRLSRSNIGELSASQDALNALAADTGGKAILNTGRLTEAVNDALRETSNYYLLAWRPSTEEQKSPSFKRVEVSVVGRPELTVRVPRGFISGEPKAMAKGSDAKGASGPSQTTTSTSPKGREEVILSALASSLVRTGLPTKLSLSFVDVPNSGPVLTIATQMATDVLGYGADGKQTASINVGGVVLNDQGKQAGGFKTRVDVKPNTNTTVQNPGVIYSHKIPLKPGIYQVRVAASDDKSGRVGSAAQWVEIPDLADKRLTLSSLLVGGQFIGSDQKGAGGSAAEQVQFSVDRRFAKGGKLNFLTFIYNAARGANNAAPELEGQIRVVRSGQAILTSPQRKIELDANTDFARIVYGANIALQTLPAGRYLLQVTILDKLAKSSTTQHITFEIE